MNEIFDRSESEQLCRRLHNVFRILAQPNDKRCGEAFKLRDKISETWRHQAKLDKWFPWPTTSAPRGTGGLNKIGWTERGMLDYLGYHVGNTQPTPQRERELILEYTFECHLPPLNGHSYYVEWAKPQTPQRLKKLANTLAAFTRNAKRRESPSLTTAIDDWEHDLQFLRERYYENLFCWPGTEPWH